GGRINLPPLGWSTFWLGFALMIGIGIVVGWLPAMRGMRLRIVDALAGR
ncbi:MAG: ABC transporter permease, partial [Rudaea sp.]